MAVNGRDDKDQEDGKMEEEKRSTVYMWGYLPGVSVEKSPILNPITVKSPDEEGYVWKDVCGGGCGFAMALSGGKLMTWGSADDEIQSYITGGKHGKTPEAFLLPSEASIVKAAAGWAHCVSVTETGEVYTWGWKECVPHGKFPRDDAAWGAFKKDNATKENVLLTEQASQCSKLAGGAIPILEDIRDGEEIVKRRRVSVVKEESESAQSGDEYFTATPAVVSLGPGVKIISVAAGGRHTLALSDAGELLTFGWGLYGQCGQGSTNDQLSPTSLPSLSGIQVERIAAGLWHTLCIAIDGRVYAFGGNQFGQLGTGADHGESIPRLLDAPCLESKQAKMVSCGARHSAILTVDGQVFSWGWNKYGQLGVGDSMDRNIPSQVPIDGCRPKNVACGWWHTLLLAETPLKS